MDRILEQLEVYQVYTSEHKATNQIYVDEKDAQECAEKIGGFVCEARLIMEREITTN